MDEMTQELIETQQQIGDKMKDILHSDGFCFGVCKKNEKDAEISEKLKTIEERLDENEIQIRCLEDIEKKKIEEIKKMKEKNSQFKVEIERLRETLLQKKTRQNSGKVQTRERSTYHVDNTMNIHGHATKGETTWASGNRIERTRETSHAKAESFPSVVSAVRNKSTPPNRSNKDYRAKNLLDVSGANESIQNNSMPDLSRHVTCSSETALSKENKTIVKTESNKSSNFDEKPRTLVLRIEGKDEREMSEEKLNVRQTNIEKTNEKEEAKQVETVKQSEENGAAGGKEDILDKDKASMQLVPMSTEKARRAEQTSNDQRIVRRGDLEVAQYEQERWINNHKCVHQTQKKQCMDMSWSFKAQAIKQKVLREGLFEVDAAQSLLLIDTSESMAANGAWEQTCKFVHEYLNGIEEMALDHNIKQERVGMVTFGRHNDVVQHLTFDMQQVRRAFDQLELGGPSPLYGGLILMDGALSANSFDANGLAVYPKIILITDGNPTETDLIGGPDKMNPSCEQAAKSRILGVAESISTMEIDVFCVPVGNGSTDFLSLLVEMSDGIMLNPNDGRNLARRLYLTMEASREISSGLSFMRFLNGMYWDPEHNMMCRTLESPLDRADKDKIASRIRRREGERMDRLHKEIYRESEDTNLPKVGSRVRRGPDMDPANTLDKDGPGTIIGHSSDENCVNVAWDNTGRLVKCLYGKNSQYEVVLVEEPRIVSDEVLMATGCFVVPGNDWEADENFQGHDVKGICIAYGSEQGLVMVKWENGNTFNHICSHFKEEVRISKGSRRSENLRAIEPAPPSGEPRRNKNAK